MLDLKTIGHRITLATATTCRQKLILTSETVGDIDLVSMSLSKEYTESALLCVLGHTVIVIDDRQEHERVNGHG